MCTFAVIFVNDNETLTEVRLEVVEHRCALLLLDINAWVIVFYIIDQ